MNIFIIAIISIAAFLAIFFVLFPPQNETLFIPQVIIKPEHYDIEITELKDTYLVGESYSFSYILSGFGDPCGGIYITFPINKTASSGTGWIPSCLKTIQTDFVLDIGKTYGTTYGHIALNEPGNYTVKIEFEKGSNGPTVATKNFLVIDDQTIFENINNLGEIKAFLEKYPNANYRLDRDSWIVYYSIDGFIPENPEFSKSRTKSIIIELDPFGRPLVVGIECGGPVTLSAQSDVISLLNTPNWCFPDGNEIESLKQGDLVFSRSNLFLQQPLRIEGLNDTYSIDQKIEFTVKFNGTGYDCKYPHLKIENSNHEKIWESNDIVSLCDPDMKKIHIEKKWNTSNSNLGVPIFNKTGTYTLFAEFENEIVQQDFIVKQKIVYENSCKENTDLSLEKIPQFGEPSRLVFFVKQNTTAHICIKYSSNLDNEGTLNLNEESDDGYLVNYNGTKSNVSVTVNPSLIPLQNGQSTISDYVISVPFDADGVYWLWVGQMCSRIPIVTEGYPLSPDDIPVIVGFHSCPSIMLDAKIIGYSDADAKYHVAKALPDR